MNNRKGSASSTGSFQPAPGPEEKSMPDVDTRNDPSVTEAPSDLEKGQQPEVAPVSDEAPKDPNLVTLDDAENPKKWSFKRRWAATALVSLITFMTPIASSMVAPAEPAIQRDLHVQQTVVLELIFSIFLLAFVIGPLFIAPLSEVYGRVIVLQLANVWFLIWNLACGFAQTTGQMLAFRFIAGLGACAPQTVGGGVLSDLWTAEERGMAIALYTLAPLLGPSVGPLIGAWITERTTWRWSFWSVTMFGVVVQVLIFFTLSETYTPRLLQLKAQRLRKETGNQALHSQYESDDRKATTVLRRSLNRVVVLLTTQPIVMFLATYMALVYGVIYLMLGTFPLVWTQIYHESVGIGGLNYISLLIGLMAGAQTGGRIVGWLYRRLKLQAAARAGTDPALTAGRPEYRVPLLFVSGPIIAAGLLIYGWTAEAHVHWIVPNIGAAIFAAGTSLTFTALQAYTIDAYPLYAASAVGATAVTRSLTGFAFPLFGDQMMEALGWGWGNTILALAMLAIGLPGSLVLWFYGQRLREASRFAAGP